MEGEWKQFADFLGLFNESGCLLAKISQDGDGLFRAIIIGRNHDWRFLTKEQAKTRVEKFEMVAAPFYG